MAQATILAAGTTAADSTAVALASGASALLGIFGASAVPSGNNLATVFVTTPGQRVAVAVLDGTTPMTVVQGPGNFIVARAAGTQSLGVWSDT